jgi:hypothetical protein
VRKGTKTMKPGPPRGLPPRGLPPSSPSANGWQPPAHPSGVGGGSFSRPTKEGGSNYLQHTEEQDMRLAMKLQQQEQIILKNSRSGVRRFSATSVPHLHNQFTSSSEGDQFGEYGEEEEEEEKYRVKQLQEVLGEMYTGVKQSAKKIKDFQRETTRKHNLPYEEVQVQRGPPPTFDTDSLQQEVEMMLNSVQLSQNNSLLWYKDLKKRKWYATPFRFQFDDRIEGAAPTIALILQSYKGKNGEIRHPMNEFSRKATLPDEEPHNEKATSKRNKLVRNKFEMHIEPTTYNGQGKIPLIFDESSQANKMKEVVNLIIETVKAFVVARQEYDANSFPAEPDPQQMADDAQCLTAYGAGLYDAVVGEEASFEISAKDDEGNPYTEQELQELIPSYHVYDEYGNIEYTTRGHQGSKRRLNIQLFSMTKEEYDNGDYSR